MISNTQQIYMNAKSECRRMANLIADQIMITYPVSCKDNEKIVNDILHIRDELSAILINLQTTERELHKAATTAAAAKDKYLQKLYK